MYLSRIQLNRRRRDAWRLLSSPQRMHAAVLASFPDPPTGGTGNSPRVLWRLDTDGDRTHLYVVSPEPADLAHIAEQAGWPTLERGECRDYRPLLDRLEEGQSWAFRLTANPTRYVTPASGGRARRLAHVTVAQQQQWLLDKAASCGFSILATDTGEPDLAVTARTVQTFDRRGGAAPVTIGTAQFDGRLEVIDPGALGHTLVTGVGAAKAYGCGLLTLATLA